jgi:nucleoside-diphosphate-sugar epimerase
MSYLITGFTGLVASRIARKLLENGETVIGYEIKLDSDMLDMVIKNELRGNLKIVTGDIVDLNHLKRTIEEYNVHTIIHFAAIIGDAIKDNPVLATKVNVEGTINVFEAARVLKLKKVVWASSNAVFPTITPSKTCQELKLDDFIYYPWGMYGATKLFGENAAEYYFREYGVDITGLRYGPMLFGAGQQRGKSGDILRELVLKPAVGIPSKVPFGKSTISFLYVEDAARAAFLSCKLPRKNVGVYNIGGFLHPVKELFEYVKSLLPEANMGLIPEYFNGTRYDYDISLTEAELGFKPEYTIQEGIKETINMTRKYYGLPLIK